MCGITCIVKYNGTIDHTIITDSLATLKARGPDSNSFETFTTPLANVYMGFTRLAIMDKSDAGMQPFYDASGNYVICNGEIYNYLELIKDYNINMSSNCDCEVLLPLFKQFGFYETIRDKLNAEFAIVYYDKVSNVIYAARDRYGVRPLYYGYNNQTKLFGFASELKTLHPIMEFVAQVPPNNIMSIDLSKYDTECSKNFIFTEYFNYQKLKTDLTLTNIDDIHENIRNLLTNAVKTRLIADRPIGFLLSGGLDSSLIVSIATKILGPSNMVCFSIGIDGSPDVEASKEVTRFLGIKNHHIIPFDTQSGINALHQVIRTVETYDITTIRASTPQYIMAKYINENTDIRVLFSGEGSDECHGSYKYFRFAPNGDTFHTESIRLLKDLCYFDNKRTDRTMAGNGLEVRVPFLDFSYIDYITKINPELMMYRTDNIEKKLIRDAFKNYLPENILYRPKEAFSDAVSSKDIIWYHAIRDLANNKFTDEDLNNNKYQINKPKIKEALYYRQIFESYYPNRDNIIPYYWLPSFVQTEDPSATILT